jgi:glycosyltransferase involved in cell wall biosynthesis
MTVKDSAPMNILALEPYYGGSHKIFLDHLVAGSVHSWEVMSLPPRKWKWRMMHSAWTFSEEISNLYPDETLPDIIFCTDMLNLAEFKGLMPAKFADIPIVAYFHENQLTYPTHYEKARDRYFGWINVTTALAADSVWFNSEYHRSSFLDAVTYRIKKAPDCRPANLADKIRAKSIIIPQGIEKRQLRKEGRAHSGDPLRILWAARWEFDKNPGDFFDALRLVRDRGIDFRISVVGEKTRGENEIFDRAEKEFADYIDHWGFLDSPEEYEQVLAESDISVSTAIHEFFGISIAESVAAGSFPVVPERLAYPEVLKEESIDSDKESFFYDGSLAGLAEKIANCAELLKKSNSLWQGDPKRGIRKIERFYWSNVIPEVDKYLQEDREKRNRKPDESHG